MRKVAILLVLLACDSESETFRCADWLVCFDECRAFDGPISGAISNCVDECSFEAWDDEIAREVWQNDAWLEESINGSIGREPKYFYEVLRGARGVCYADG